MILKVTEINPDTIQAVRLILMKDADGYSICVEGKTQKNPNEFVLLRPPIKYLNQDQASARFESLIEELKYVCND